MAILQNPYRYEPFVNPWTEIEQPKIINNIIHEFAQDYLKRGSSTSYKALYEALYEIVEDYFEDYYQDEVPDVEET